MASGKGGEKIDVGAVVKLTVSSNSGGGFLEARLDASSDFGNDLDIANVEDVFTCLGGSADGADIAGGIFDDGEKIFEAADGAILVEKGGDVVDEDDGGFDGQIEQDGHPLGNDVVLLEGGGELRGILGQDADGVG